MLKLYDRVYIEEERRRNLGILKCRIVSVKRKEGRGEGEEAFMVSSFILRPHEIE